MKLTILIAEDRATYRRRLRQFLASESDVEVLGECSTGPKAIEAVRALRPHVILLDVRMPELDGFGVVTALAPEERPAIIFLTDSDEFALQAFQVQAVDYLLMPFDRARLQIALERARMQVTETALADDPRGQRQEGGSREKPYERLPVKAGQRITFVHTDDIDCIKSAGNYVEVFAGNSSHLLRTTISELSERLPPDRFVRISRSTIVNVARVKELRPKTHGDYRVTMQNGPELIASRTYRERLMQMLSLV